MYQILLDKNNDHYKNGIWTNESTGATMDRNLTVHNVWNGKKSNSN